MNVAQKIVLLSCMLLIVQFATGTIFAQDDAKTNNDFVCKDGINDIQHGEFQLFTENIKKFNQVKEKLATLHSFSEKMAYLYAYPEVVEFFITYPDVKKMIEAKPAQEQYVFLQFLSLGQGKVVFDGYDTLTQKEQAVDALFSVLKTVDQFYMSLGGIVGYHVKVLELMQEQISPTACAKRFFPPPYRDIRVENREIRRKIIEGIKAHEDLAELYAIGGAGDRLDLHHETTGLALPAARLPFLGKTLLHMLMEDLQAREWLFYKLYHKSIVTPIVLMTSEEKNNDHEIEAILQEADWFQRPQSSFLRIVQPQTPVITNDGKWAISKPLELLEKPGGHGVIWKLIQEKGGFDWLAQQKRKYLLVKQINNVLAGLDYGQLVPIGIGVSEKKAFGFGSCNRKPGASEGVNVLQEVKENERYLNTITNIEYTEFAKHSASIEKELPANTNILFANIEEVQKAQKRLPIPGMLVNMKHNVTVWENGKHVVKRGARLESTMQNVADSITDEASVSFAVTQQEPSKTFVTLNDREKTISVTKKSYDGTSIFETPQGAFYDLVKENIRLLNQCKVQTPVYSSSEEYLRTGPHPLFVYHPALGPLYSVIQQKIRGGSLTAESELRLHIAEVDFEDVHVDGSLIVYAENPLGIEFSGWEPLYTERCGRCVLQRVSIKNEGIDRTAPNAYWKNSIVRKQALTITLQGQSEFEAKDVVFTEPMDIVVPNGKRAVAKQKQDGSVSILFEERKQPSWQWKYQLREESDIILSR